MEYLYIDSVEVISTTVTVLKQSSLTDPKIPNELIPYNLIDLLRKWFISNMAGVCEWVNENTSPLHSSFDMQFCSELVIQFVSKYKMKSNEFLFVSGKYI